MIRSLLPLALLAASATASAEWTPTAELGLVSTSGNSDTTSANGKFSLEGTDELWTHEYFLASLRAAPLETRTRTISGGIRLPKSCTKPGVRTTANGCAKSR